MGLTDDEIANIAGKQMADHIDKTIILELMYPESYTVAYGHDISARTNWLDANEDSDWAYYDRTFYFSNKKQKTFFLLRWAE
jgi:hypothetical protein